jgi:hypothetical protein
MPECGNCAFFADVRSAEVHTQHSRSGSYGLCRRHPPTVIPRQNSGMSAPFSATVWPTVNKSDEWCGEYRARTNRGATRQDARRIDELELM